MGQLRGHELLGDHAKGTGGHLLPVLHCAWTEFPQRERWGRYI